MTGIISIDTSYTPSIAINSFYPIINQSDGIVHINIGLTNTSQYNETFIIVSVNKSLESNYHKHITGTVIILYK